VRRAAATLVGCLIATTLTAPAPAAAGPPAVPTFHIEQALKGYQKPLYVTAHSNPNLLYVVEQRGMILVARRANGSSPWAKAGTFLDIRSLVKGPFDGRGLLGMAFDPAYSTNGRFYVLYTRRSSKPALNGDVVVAEFQRNTDLRAKPSSRRIVLVIPHDTEYHFGGWIGFGPDGYLYVTSGDDSDFDGPSSQDKNSRLGKILRLNPHAKQNAAAQIPSDNPYVGIEGDDFVWASGLRNPWRASFDFATGTFWLSDVGQSTWEEVNRFSPASTAKGANLGWNLCEGAHAFPQPAAGPEPCAAAGTVAPLVEYQHADGNCSTIGGYVYRGSAQPALVGRDFYGDYCTGNIWSVPAGYSSGDPVAAPLATGKQITSFGTDSLGEMYMTGFAGAVWHIVQD